LIATRTAPPKTFKPDDKIDTLVSQPTTPYTEMSFGMGTDGFPAISMTQHAANKIAKWLSAQTGPLLPPAHRGRVGIRRPRWQHHGLLLGR